MIDSIVQTAHESARKLFPTIDAAEIAIIPVFAHHNLLPTELTNVEKFADTVVDLAEASLGKQAVDEGQDRPRSTSAEHGDTEKDIQSREDTEAKVSGSTSAT
jgi:hypothetical protein